MIDPVSLTVIGFMTVSPRLRRLGLRIAFVFFGLAFVVLVIATNTSGGSKDDTMGFFFGMLACVLIGVVLLIYWAIAGVARWLLGIVAEDLEDGNPPARQRPRSYRGFRYPDEVDEEPRFEESAAKTEHARPWYEVLQVSPTATYPEVSAAFRRRSKEYHPDRVATLGSKLREMAEQEMKAINAAFEEATAQRQR